VQKLNLIVELGLNATDLREKFGRGAAFGDNRVSGKNAKCEQIGSSPCQPWSNGLTRESHATKKRG
jgi:hypothetical protein